MKTSRKITVLVPPLLIGFTILMVLFTYHHNQNLAQIDGSFIATTTEQEVLVTEPLPEPTYERPVEPQLIFCAADAKQCPDGSFVARTGPNCEFAECLVLDAVNCPADAKICPDGSAVSRTGPNCEFPACAAEQRVQKFCSDDSRLAEMCTKIYAPVCAAVRVECVTTPCNPVPETYPNECVACMNERVLSFQEGECSL